MPEVHPVIGFYSPSEDEVIWKTRIERDLPAFQFELLEYVEEKQFVKYALVWSPPNGLLNTFENLKAVFVLGAGVDALLRDPNLPSIPIVRLEDAGMAQQMAHYVIYGVLRFQRRFEEYEDFQIIKQWKPLVHIEPIEQFSVGVMGLGAIGLVVAEQVSRLGFPVLGWSTSPKEIDGIRTFYGEDGLVRFLAEARVVVDLLPLTAATEKLINRKFLNRMSADSFLINIGRGAHLLEDDLLEALEQRVIAGAMLDVFEQEPLPLENPLWNHPKVIVTPHVSGITMPQVALDQIISNIKLLESGGTPKALVDRKKGY
ncbi:glyoxylate/hydroxypyruvate reductase A [Burkholderiales bacterium]|nr:glyoxylate/hydroxypyruvate reductase A [Burkholderiales bacterium]